MQLLILNKCMNPHITDSSSIERVEKNEKWPCITVSNDKSRNKHIDCICIKHLDTKAIHLIERVLTIDTSTLYRPKRYELYFITYARIGTLPYHNTQY